MVKLAMTPHLLTVTSISTLASVSSSFIIPNHFPSPTIPLHSYTRRSMWMSLPSKKHSPNHLNGSSFSNLSFRLRGGAMFLEATPDDDVDVDVDVDVDNTNVEDNNDNNDNNDEATTVESIEESATVKEETMEDIHTISPLLENTNQVQVQTIEEEEEEEESLTGSYKIASLLWCSLLLDVLMNPTKRTQLFGTSIYPRISHAFAQANSNAALSLTLASGFWHAAGLALIGSLDMTYTKRLAKKQQLQPPISSSPLTHSMSFYLILFAACHLLAQAVPKAPYLGMSAGVIQIHNLLVALKEWKDSKPINYSTMTFPSIRKFMTLPLPNSSSSLSLSQKLPYYTLLLGYKIPLLFFSYQILSTLSSLLFHSSSITSLPMFAMLDYAPARALQIASLGTSIVLFGTFLILHQNMPILNGWNNEKDDDYRKDVLSRKGVYQVLNGITSISTLMGAIAHASSIMGGFGSKTLHWVRCMTYLFLSIFTGLQFLVPHFFQNQSSNGVSMEME